MKIIKATYGSGECVLDVTERLQKLVRNGCLSVTVSNRHFTDPCPGKIKTLEVVYELPGSARFYRQKAKEHELLLAPVRESSSIGIFYTNNSISEKHLARVLRQLKDVSGGTDILTCSWHPIQDNPFPEIRWTHHASSHLTIVLQILKLLHTARRLNSYEHVFFLEHDVLYPEGYFNIKPFSEDVLYNTNYIGLCDKGFQTAPANLISLHLLTMKLPAAIEHFTSSIERVLLNPSTFMLEPHGRSIARRRTTHPVVHINHGTHVTGYHTLFHKDKFEEFHPYWGDAADWWD